jgi:hypothetical protein
MAYLLLFSLNGERAMETAVELLVLSILVAEIAIWLLSLPLKR